MSNAVNIRHEAADITTAIEDDLLALVRDMQDRLTKLESRDTRGLLGKLFGKGSAAALLLAVFLISGTAWATYNSYGVGNASCGAWTEDKKTEGASYWQKAEWIFGYLTAYSRWVEGPVLGPVGKSDVSGTRAWVDNYCQENPLELVAEAAEQLIGAIEAQ